mgnify:CR=1 FL=1
MKLGIIKVSIIHNQFTHCTSNVKAIPGKGVIVIRVKSDL